jgi:hypothetical protein
MAATRTLTEDVDRISGDVASSTRIRDVDLLIIDEISMLSARLYAQVWVLYRCKMYWVCDGCGYVTGVGNVQVWACIGYVKDMGIAQVCACIGYVTGGGM